MCTVFLLDIDCFFASVETAINPSLRGKPLCIGGLRTDRGIVACPNYEARRYGVRTAMPLRTAARLLPPEAVFMRGNYERYSEYSDNIMAMLQDFTPDVRQMSVDEAYMDVTGCLHFWGGNPQRMAEAIKERIRREYGLTVSIGIAANMTCAKIAAGYGKPDGLVFIPSGRERDFLAPLPVEVVPGVGMKTLPKLHARGIRTIGDALVCRNPHDPLTSLLSFIASCTVPSTTPFHSHEQIEHSISRNRTFGRDTPDRELIRSTLYCLTERCCKALRRKDRAASTVTVRVRFADFTTTQKQTTLAAPSSNEEDIFAASQRLLAILLPPDDKHLLVRLVGIGVSNLRGPGERQQDLGMFSTEHLDTLHRRLDALQSRYGYASIRWGITCGAVHTREEPREKFATLAFRRKGTRPNPLPERTCMQAPWTKEPAGSKEAPW
jgi:DNA polymerase-4